MKRPQFLISLFLVVQTTLCMGQETARPKIGLTLSGGGARGLAHIGILKAIDSAGLKIDCITGTSMGAVMGSLYAIGYTGNEIENIARNTDWNRMLSNQTDLRSLSMEEKEEYGKYSIELPFEKRKFRLPSGALDPQELWLKLSELYFPVHNIKDFTKLKIPFKCLATDIESAEPVVLDSGELLQAIRASIAIPGLFSPVEMGGRKLVDGGVVRNLPVLEAKSMGADFMLVSNVSQGLRSKEKLTNPIQVLYQIAFFMEKEDNVKQVSQSDEYILHPLDGYTAADFNAAQSIIDSGIAMGLKLYPRFKQIADSLEAVYGETSDDTSIPGRSDSVYISSYAINGLNAMSRRSFLHSINYHPDAWYTPRMLTENIRRGYGTRNFSNIRYSLIPENGDSSKIIFDVDEIGSTHGKLGMSYNTFMGIGAQVNMTTRNFLTRKSKSFVSLNLGENLRLRGEHLQYLGKFNHIALVPGFQYERFRIGTYNDFKRDGIYISHYLKTDLRLQMASDRSYTMGIGVRREWMNYSPTTPAILEVSGSNRFWTSYGFAALNTLDKPHYPNKGYKLNGELAWIYAQEPDPVYREVAGSDKDSSTYSTGNYLQASLFSEAFYPINSKLVFSSMFQVGANADPLQNLLNAFYVGGLTRMYRNQILFAGLQDFTVYSNSVAAAQAALRLECYENLYLIGRTNVMAYDFIRPSGSVDKSAWVSGSSITMAYKSMIGPIELSFMYSRKTKALQTYVTIGVPF